MTRASNASQKWICAIVVAALSVGSDAIRSGGIARANSLCTPEHTYLGNLPKEKAPGWHSEVQGVAHDDTNWYFSQNRGGDPGDPRVWRIPVSQDLSRDVHCGQGGVSCATFSDTPLSGYDHVGDISWRDGFLFAAIEGPDADGATPPAIAVFRGDASLEYVDHAGLPAQNVSFWVAVDPDQGFLYSSDRNNHVDSPFTKHAIDWASLNDPAEPRLEIDPVPWIVSLLDEASQPLEFVDMQGGAYSDEDGEFLYIINGLDRPCGEAGCGIHLFDARLEETDLPCGAGPGDCVARRIARSTNGGGAFNYEYHPGWSLYQEPEGITFWNLDDSQYDAARETAGETDHGNPLGGQLHALMLDNDLFGDDAYLKHYRVQGLCKPGGGIVVSARALDFGDVGVGGSKLEAVLISNAGIEDLQVERVVFAAASDPSFAIAAPPLPVVLAPGDEVQLALAFTPVAEGTVQAIFEVASDDADEPLVSVFLVGNGVSLPDQAENLIEALGEGVGQGDLTGSGPGGSAAGRLRALRNMLVTGASLVEQDRIDEACAQYQDALDRTDGDSPPGDFVAGLAAPDLAAAIARIRSNLGCN